MQVYFVSNSVAPSKSFDNEKNQIILKCPNRKCIDQVSCMFRVSGKYLKTPEDPFRPFSSVFSLQPKPLFKVSF